MTRGVPKSHKRTEIRLDKEIHDEAAKVRKPGETLTDQVEDGLRRHIKARRKRQVSD